MASDTGRTSSPGSSILLVEDDDIHAMLTEKALRRAGFGAAILRAGDGQQALEALLGKGRFEGCGRPGLVILDLKIPKVPGLEVLRAVRQAPEGAGLAIVMLSTSDDPHEREAALLLGADAYVTKSGNPREFRDQVGLLFRQWFRDEAATDAGEVR